MMMIVAGGVDSVANGSGGGDGGASVCSDSG